jgi:MoxR-like ATPase
MNLPTAARLRALLAQLEGGLLEREAAARLALLAGLAGEHVLLIGPPGTAKSELARRLHRCFTGGPYFERLLTRFSTPEELFGPLSLKALEDDRYERLTTGFLPAAGIAFLDEVFKANSAILNALLTLLNEREFDNGSGRVRTPLVCVVAASNELPADDALLAFFDRFLLRVAVAPVADASFTALLTLAPSTPQTSAEPVNRAELTAIVEAAAAVRLGDDALAACAALRHWLAARGQSLSDRRWRLWIGLMRVAAATEGRDHIDVLDLWLAPFVAAATPAESPALAEWFERDLMLAVPHTAPWLTHAVEAFERQLEIEQSARNDADADNTAGKLALARAISGDGRAGDADAGDGANGGMLRMVSATLEAQLRRHYSPVHIAARLAQIDELNAHSAVQRDAVADRATRLAGALTGRIWLPPALASRLLGAHAQTLAVLDGLLARLQSVRHGFAQLPVDGGLPATAPAPVAIEDQAA